MEKITVTTTVTTPLEATWEYYTNPTHIIGWNFASDDWHCPHAENTLEVGATFTSTMAAKDGSASFDFSGTYTEIIPLAKIAYILPEMDFEGMHFAARNVEVIFEKISDSETKVTTTFDPETLNAPELQRDGWQAILNNFKTYCESKQ